MYDNLSNVVILETIAHKQQIITTLSENNVKRFRLLPSVKEYSRYLFLYPMVMNLVYCYK